MKKLVALVSIFGVTLGMGIMCLSPVVGAVDDIYNCTDPANATTVICQEQGRANGKSLTSMIPTVINIMLYALGAISVIMVIVGGIRYTTSAGNDAAVKKAKDTIMYAVIGVVVALLAYAVVNLVVKVFTL
ncbi:MAG: hypothetical protein WCP11_00530 [Candidatus Saccharibacteria bacterium]